MGEQLASPITYLVALSFNSDEDYLPADEPHEAIVMDFDSDYYESDYEDFADQRL